MGNSFHLFSTRQTEGLSGNNRVYDDGRNKIIPFNFMLRMTNQRGKYI